jgi:hypothetical protein
MMRPSTLSTVGLAAIAVAASLAASSCVDSTVNFCIESAKAACQVQYRCCTAVERQSLFGNLNVAIGPYDDEGGCVDAFTRQCEAGSQATDESIAAGRLAFDAERANECVNGRREAASACDANEIFNSTDESCRDLTTGLVADGDPCFNDGECAETGSTCEPVEAINDDGSFTITIEGACKGQGDLGEDCIDGNRCNGDLRCLITIETGARTCEQPRGPGVACQVDFDCDDALSCRQNPNTGAFTCTAPAGPGDPCSQDADCQDGLACVQELDGGGFQCIVAGGVGAPCFNSDDNCQSGLLCVFDGDIGTSVCAGTSGAGEECLGGTPQCEPGLECLFDNVSQTNRCFAAAAGDPCNVSGRACSAGLVCRNSALNGRDECQPPADLNDACESFAPISECDSDLRCINSSCVQQLDPGDLCTQTTPDPCDDDHVCAFDAGVGDDICVPRLGGGDACFDDDACAGDFFCDRFGTDVCVARRNSNQACDETRQCAPGLECRLNDTNTANICRPLSVLGQVCSNLDDCVGGLDCRSDDAGLRNICRGFSAEDQRCQDQGDCGPQLDCRPDDDNNQNVCRAISAEGEGCVNALDCSAGLECRQDFGSSDLVCLGPSAAGERCSFDSDCVPGLVCRLDDVDGVFECSNLGGEGASCTGDQDCTAPLRCRDVTETGDFTCTIKLDNFEECDEDADCLSNFCDPNNGFCDNEPAEIDFEQCDGI